MIPGEEYLLLLLFFFKIILKLSTWEDIALLSELTAQLFRDNAKLFVLGLPRRLSGTESACQYMRDRFDPWVEKIPWRRK